MNKIILIFKREYFEHVKKRSFIISTVLAPIILPLFFVLMGYLMEAFKTEDKRIIIIDESQLFSDLKISGHPIEYSNQSFEQVKAQLNTQSDIHGLLYIPEITIDYPRGIAYYSISSPSLFFTEKIRRPMREVLRGYKMKELNLNQAIIEQLNIDVAVKTFLVSEQGESKQSNSTIASGIGYTMGFMIYMFMAIYGAFIMQAVLNEKSSKIIEIIISSVKPMHLMMGKMLGIGAVALTQIFIWSTMMFLFTTIAATVFGYQAASPQLDAASVAAEGAPQLIISALDVLYALPYGQLLGFFLLYFIGGFFLYGSFYAAIGGAVDTMQEAQQFNIVMAIPIVISIMPLMIIPEQPHSTLAISASLFPLTSPVSMMARISFGVPAWQLATSVGLLALAVIGGFWIAGKIYRIGILSSGSKVTYKTLWQWLFYQ